MPDLVRLSVKRDKASPSGNVKIMINGQEIKGLFGLELNMRAGEINTAILYAYVDQVDVDAEVLARLVDITPEPETEEENLCLSF